MDERLETTSCYRHPDRVTRLRCSRCGRPICAECSRDAPVGQQCPECARPTDRYREVRGRDIIAGPSFATSPVTFTIIGITLAVFVLGFLSTDMERRLIEEFSAFNPYIAAGDWWRVLTAAFLHGGLMHIMFNMYALYLFGPRLERESGSVPFALFYLAAAAGGGAASYLFGPFNQASVGASGAIFGLFGAWMYVAYLLRKSPQGRAMFNQLGALLVINLALPFIIPNIDWRAHLGGLVTGVVIAAAWNQFASRRTDAVRIRSLIAGTALVAMILLVILT